MPPGFAKNSARWALTRGEARASRANAISPSRGAARQDRSFQTLAGLDDAQQRELGSMVGRAELNPTQVDRARTLIEGSGAVAEVEQIIARDHDAALRALTGARLSEPGRVALIELARQCVQRES